MNDEIIINTCSWYDPSCALQWFQDEFIALSIWVYDSILSGLALLMESIPVPEFLLNTSTLTIPASVAWAASPFQLDVGAAIIVSAYTARFILRRIPGVG